jgi:hypothetical protein
MTPTKRTDCIAFEPKNHKNDCGDCQTDGHYLCIGCRNIASFDDMEYHDNKMTYYFNEVVKTIVGEFFDQIFNMTPNKKRGGKVDNEMTNVGINRWQEVTLTVGELIDMLKEAGISAGLRSDEAESDAWWLVIKVKDKIK